MKFKRPILASLTLLFCAALANAQWDIERQKARHSLRVLDGIVVNASVGSLDAFPDDPTERELQESVEKRLRDAGIRVVKRPYGPSDSFPTLNVSLSFLNFDIFYYTFQMRVELRQEVSPIANPSLKLMSTTWDWGSSGFTSYSKQDQISGHIDQFICDFRKANPNIKGPLPDCDRQSHDSADSDKPRDKTPTVMTKLEDQLIRAAALNELKEAKALLRKGADVNAHDPADSTPLSYAVRSGNRKTGDGAVIELLLAHGANPNVSMSCRLTPLMSAINRHDLKVAQALLEHGADVNAATPEGFTVLMAASILGSPDAVALLIKRGAKVDARSRNGQTALSLALANTDRIASYDRASDSPPYTSIPEDELLKQARQKHGEVVQLLRKAGATDR